MTVKMPERAESRTAQKGAARNNSQTGRTGRSDAVCGRTSSLATVVGTSVPRRFWNAFGLPMTCGASTPSMLLLFWQPKLLFPSIGDILLAWPCSRPSSFAQTTPRNAQARTIVSCTHSRPPSAVHPHVRRLNGTHTPSKAGFQVLGP